MLDVAHVWVKFKGGALTSKDGAHCIGGFYFILILSALLHLWSFRITFKGFV